MLTGATKCLTLGSERSHELMDSTSGAGRHLGSDLTSPPHCPSFRSTGDFPRTTRDSSLLLRNKYITGIPAARAFYSAALLH